MPGTVGILLHAGHTMQGHNGQVNFPQLCGGEQSSRLETKVLAELREWMETEKKKGRKSEYVKLKQKLAPNDFNFHRSRTIHGI